MTTLNSLSIFVLYALVALLFLERKRQKDKLKLVSTTPNQFLSGRGVPTNTLGQNGDTYLDLTTGNIYKKTNNIW